MVLLGLAWVLTARTGPHKWQAPGSLKKWFDCGPCAHDSQYLWRNWWLTFYSSGLENVPNVKRCWVRGAVSDTLLLCWKWLLAASASSDPFLAFHFKSRKTFAGLLSSHWQLHKPLLPPAPRFQMNTLAFLQTWHFIIKSKPRKIRKTSKVRFRKELIWYLILDYCPPKV